MKLEDILKQTKENQPYGYNFENGNYILKVNEVSLDKIKTKKGTMYKLNISCDAIKPVGQNQKPFNLKYLQLDNGLFFNCPSNQISTKKKEKKILEFLITLSMFNNKSQEIYNIEGEWFVDIVNKIILLNSGFMGLSFASVVVKEEVELDNKKLIRFNIPYSVANYKCIAKDIITLPEYNPIFFEKNKEVEENKQEPANEQNQKPANNDLPWLE